MLTLLITLNAYSLLCLPPPRPLFLPPPGLPRPIFQSAANVYAHLLTTGVSLVGVFGLLNLALAGSSPASGKASSAAGSKGGKEAAPSANLPLLALSLSWIGVRYTVRPRVHPPA